ncbi:BlaI/MecI/CopY family transcriptional regulator [Streptomyces sp. NPDC048172]|uniref:BlaI/MecI/CopY family transcriptional regulator n=1 Tax=Streptomyces sp. NPDC048172 TaxID=3365505 RepID=UPI003711D6A1
MSLQVRVLDLLSSADRPLQGREIQERLNQEQEHRLAYTTVLTVLRRLVEAGAAARERSGRLFLYQATCRGEVGLAVRKVFAHYGADAVEHFVAQARADPALWAQLATAVAGPASPRWEGSGPAADAAPGRSGWCG